MSNKKGIEKHCEYLESKIRKKQWKIDNLRQERDLYKSVIDEAKELLKEYVTTEEYCGYVGIETTNFIEKLEEILHKTNIKENENEQRN